MKKYILIILCAFLCGVGTNIGHPITPYYINQINLNKSSFTYFFAAMSIAMLIFTPLWGAIGDSGKRKTVFIVSLFGYGLFQILFGLFRSFQLILVMRFCAGIFSGGMLVSLLSYISRSKVLVTFNISKLNFTFVSMHLVGTSVGQFLGGLLGNIFNPHYEYALFVQGIFHFIFALVMLFILNIKDEEQREIRSKNPFVSLKEIKLLPFSLIFFLILVALLNISFTDISKYLDVYFSNQGYASLSLGLVNLVVGFVVLIINIFITPFVLKKTSNLIALSFTAILGGVMIYLTFIQHNLMFGLYSFYLIFIVCKAIMEGLTVNFLSHNKQISPGILLGLRQSFISLGGIFGIIIGGVIFDIFDVYLFFLCALILIIVGIFSLILNYYINNKRRNHE